MGAGIQSYRDLQVWETGMSLAEDCYRRTQDFPKEEQVGLTAQIRRAAASVPANIAEGHGCETTKRFIQFLRISQGSLKELETHLLLSKRVGLIPEDPCLRVLDKCNNLGKMLRGLIRSLQRKEEIAT
ncbi:MAG: four helix bundle protein [Pseudomonadota bacterium]